MNGLHCSLRHAFIPAAAVLGIMLALIVPKPAGATWHSYYIEMWPGGGSQLNCGWHEGPCWDDDSQVQSGAALDWGSSSSISHIVKSSTGSGLFAVAGQGYATTTAATCLNRVYVSIYDNLAGLQAGTEFLHTSPSITNHKTWYISTSTLGVVTTTEPLGSTANESGCSAWTGHHVHQKVEGWVLRSYPDHSTCNRPDITTDCWVGAAHKQADKNWSIWVP